MMKIIIFITIALLITLPWFMHPGYLFLLDWSGIPHPQIQLDQTGGISGMPVTILWNLLSFGFGTALGQILVIFLMLVLAGTTTSLLISKFISRKVSPNIAQIIVITSGIFAMTNPFV